MRISSPAVLSSVSNLLLNARTDLQTQRMLISQAYEIMHLFATHHNQVRFRIMDPPKPHTEPVVRVPNSRRRYVSLRCA